MKQLLALVWGWNSMRELKPCNRRQDPKCFAGHETLYFHILEVFLFYESMWEQEAAWKCLGTDIFTQGSGGSQLLIMGCRLLLYLFSHLSVNDLIECLKKLWQQMKAKESLDLPRPTAVQGRRTVTEDSFQQKVTLITPVFYSLHVCSGIVTVDMSIPLLLLKEVVAFYYMPRKLRRRKSPFWSC